MKDITDKTDGLSVYPGALADGLLGDVSGIEIQRQILQKGQIIAGATAGIQKALAFRQVFFDQSSDLLSQRLIIAFEQETLAAGN